MKSFLHRRLSQIFFLLHLLFFLSIHSFLFHLFTFERKTKKKLVDIQVQVRYLNYRIVQWMCKNISEFSISIMAHPNIRVTCIAGNSKTFTTFVFMKIFPSIQKFAIFLLRAEFIVYRLSHFYFPRKDTQIVQVNSFFCTYSDF